MKKITNEIIKESIDKNMNTFRKKALSGKVSGQDVAELFGFGELYETEETIEDNISPLMECWRQKYLTLEGKEDTTTETPDDHKTDKTFIDADEYEKWMKEREKMMSELEPKEVNEDEDEDDEEENLIEKIENLKEKLVSTLEEVVSKKDEYEEDEIKNSIQLLYSIDPEKVSEEDIAMINPDSEENVENTEENSEEDEEN